MESEFYVTLPSNSSMQYFPDNKTSNFVTKLSRTLQLDGEWEVGLAEIDYPHTWYNIREGRNSVEIYARDKLDLVFQTVEYSIQPEYYEKVQDVIDAMRKAGLDNLTEVVLSYVTVKCSKGTVLKLRGDIARMFGFLNDTTIRASDEKGFTLALPETGNQYFMFIQISSRANTTVMLSFLFFVLLQ